MNQSTKRTAALVLLAPALTAHGQKPTAPSAASVPASQAEPNIIVNPGDPTWMVVDVGIALVAGLIVGYLIGVWRSSAKQRASHA